MVSDRVSTRSSDETLVSINEGVWYDLDHTSIMKVGHTLRVYHDVCIMSIMEVYHDVYHEYHGGVSWRCIMTCIMSIVEVYHDVYHEYHGGVSRRVS